MNRAARVLACTDWTTLAFDETESDLERLLSGAEEHGVATCCIPREWLGWWVERRSSARQRVATVLNFPDGLRDLAQIETEAREAAPAEEWDVVLPYRALQSGDEGPSREVLTAVREWAGKRTLKVILETGATWSRTGLQRAAELALEGGADFLKTSTGKVPVGATHEAVDQLLDVLKGTGKGLKVSGGIRTLEAALAYVEQVEAAMGLEYLQPPTFRFGTSTLLLP